MIKVSIPVEINNRPRVIYPVEMKRGVWLTRWIRNWKQAFQKSFVFFEEPVGAYLRGTDGALGATVFRTFPKEFFESGKQMIPMFGLIADDPSTEKPLFFKSISSLSSPTSIWNWFDRRILSPILAIVKKVSYEKGMGMQLHSQNMVAEIDEDTQKITGRFGYRDLGGAYPDLPGMLVRGDVLPEFSQIIDFKRELGMEYLRGKSLLDWMSFFFKEQVSDPILIQLAKFQLIDRATRESWKKRAMAKIQSHYQKVYRGQFRFYAGEKRWLDGFPSDQEYFSFSESNEDERTQSATRFLRKGPFTLAVDTQLNRAVGLGFPAIRKTFSKIRDREVKDLILRAATLPN